MTVPKFKLAAIGAMAVVLAMVAATIAFNLFIGWKVESDAIADLEYAIDVDATDDSDTTGRSPSYVFLNQSYAIDQSDLRWCSDEEVKLAAWFARHPQVRTTERIALGDWTCYAVLQPYDYFEPAHDAEDYAGPEEELIRVAGYYIAYIDISGEESLILTVDTAFAIIALVGAALAATAGYMAGKRIERSQEAQKRFYENMSHELKTPLAAIRGYAEGARNNIVPTDDALRAIERESNRMTATIDQILGLSRLEAGAVELHKEPLVMEDFVQDCLMPFEGIARSRGLDVELELAAGVAEADPDLFEHALANTLSNAFRHAKNIVRIGYDGRELWVWNDGDVPPADQLPSLFDRFRTGEGGSTGLGLAIAREICELHGWTLSASVENDGLRMSFLLA